MSDDKTETNSFNCISGANKTEDADPRFFVPIIDNHRLPKSVRCFFRFGVPSLDKADYQIHSTELTKFNSPQEE